MNVIIAAITIFSMFFGAGNLIYPIAIGSASLSNFTYGIFGLVFTGVFVPFLGLFGISLYRGDINKFFQVLGSTSSFLLIALILAIIGPLFAVPRCILVAFSGFKLILPNFNFVIFNLIFCLLMAIAAIKKNEIVNIIGKWLTPFLIFGVMIIIIAGLFSEGNLTDSTLLKSEVFGISALEGYNTMDLLGGLFFAKIIFDYLKNAFGANHENIGKKSIIACTAGIGLLAIVYAALIYISAKYASSLQSVPRQDLLIELSKILLGKFAAPVAALTIVMACFTTAIALNELVVEWFSENFKAFLNARVALLIVTSICFMIAMVSFEKLTFAIGYLLYYMYPALIILTISNIVSYYYSNFNKLTPYLFWGSIVTNLFYSIV